MTAPDKIYMPNELLSEEWQRHIEGQDTEYISKDALLDLAKEKMNINLEEADKTDDRFTYGIATGFCSVIDKLNSM